MLERGSHVLLFVLRRHPPGAGWTGLSPESSRSRHPWGQQTLLRSWKPGLPLLPTCLMNTRIHGCPKGHQRTHAPGLLGRSKTHGVKNNTDQTPDPPPLACAAPELAPPLKSFFPDLLLLSIHRGALAVASLQPLGECLVPAPHTVQRLLRAQVTRALPAHTARAPQWCPGACTLQKATAPPGLLVRQTG